MTILFYAGSLYMHNYAQISLCNMPNLKINKNFCKKGIDKASEGWYTCKAVACGGDFIGRKFAP
jgi:hypothetical protein